MVARMRLVGKQAGETGRERGMRLRRRMEGLQEFLLAFAPVTYASGKHAADEGFTRLAAQRAQRGGAARPRRQQRNGAGQAAGLVAAGHQQALPRVLQANAALVVGVQLSGCRADC